MGRKHRARGGRVGGGGGRGGGGAGSDANDNGAAVATPTPAQKAAATRARNKARREAEAAANAQDQQTDEAAAPGALPAGDAPAPRTPVDDPFVTDNNNNNNKKTPSKKVKKTKSFAMPAQVRVRADREAYAVPQDRPVEEAMILACERCLLYLHDGNEGLLPSFVSHSWRMLTLV